MNKGYLSVLFTTIHIPVLKQYWYIKNLSNYDKLHERTHGYLKGIMKCPWVIPKFGADRETTQEATIFMHKSMYDIALLM